MTKEYTIPTQTRIGHVHLKVSDLDRSLAFYCDLLGFELVTTYGDQAAFISAGGYHHHIGLNTWHSKGTGPAPINSAGLYHVAILYPTRKDLAFVYRRVSNANYPFTGASDCDHAVSPFTGRNRYSAATASTMKRRSTTTCVKANGGSDCVGARALSAGTFWKS